MSVQKNRAKQKWYKKYSKNNDGTTAIEFAILGIPFAALLFGIIELGVVFFISSTLDFAVSTVSREVRTGEFQASNGTKAQFKDAVCKAMKTVGNCDNLRIDVITNSSGKFSDLKLPKSPAPCDPTDTACQENPPTIVPDNYTVTKGGDVVIVRAQYFHPLAVPSTLTRLANASGNTRVINSITAFRNEPFSQ